MKIFNCDQSWPLCLYDFTYKNKIPQFLVFKASNEPPNIIENYFNFSGMQITPEKLRKNPLTKSGTSSLIQGNEGVLIERGIH